jgi:hypothetical protein
MATTKPTSPDPLIEAPPAAVPSMDYASHIGTYNRFLNLLKWFIVHMFFLAPALYFMIVAGNSIAGSILLLLAVVVLVYGLMRNPNVREDIDQAMSVPPVH